MARELFLEKGRKFRFPSQGGIANDLLHPPSFFDPHAKRP